MINKYFIALTKSLTEACFLVSGSGEIMAVNPSAGRLLGADIRTLEGQQLSALVTDPEDKVSRFMQICLSSPDPMPGFLSWRTKEGRTIECHCNGHLIFPEAGEDECFVMLRCGPEEAADNKLVALNNPLETLKASCHNLGAASEIQKKENGERTRIDNALQESEMRYRRIVNAITSYTYTVEMERDTQVKTSHSEGCVAVTGYDPEDYEKDPFLWYSMVYDEDRRLVDDMLNSVRAGKEIVPVEHRIVRRDGRVVWVRDTIVPYYDEKGLPYRYDGMIEDITERKRLEEALRTNENFLKTIIDTEPECIKILSEDGGLLLMNPAGLAMIEADSLDQVKGQCVYPMVSSDYRADFINLTNEVFQGRSGILEFEMSGLKGRRLWLETHAVPLRNDRGEISALLGVTRDVTQRKQAEVEYKTMLSTALDGFWVTDMQGHFLDVNDAYCKLLGYSREEILGMSIQEVEAGETLEDTDQHIRKIVEKGWDRFETRHRKKDGRMVDLEISVNYLETGGGRFFVYLRDITERKLTEHDREKEVERIVFLLELYDKATSLSEKEIFDYALERAVSFTESRIGYLHLVSEDQKTVSLTCWNAEALEGCKAVSDDHYPIDKAGVWADSVRGKRLVLHNDYQNLSDKKGYPDGHVTLVRHMGLPVMEGDRVLLIVGVGNKATDYDDHDVIMLQLVTNELSKILDVRRSAEALSITKFSIDRVADAIFWIWPDARIWNVNETACRRLGYTREELLLMSVPDLDPNFSVDRWSSHWDELMKLQSMQFETGHRASDGRIIPVEVTVNYMEFQGKHYLCSIARDITERKKAAEDLLRLNEELEQRVIGRTADLAGKSLELQHNQQALMNIVDDLNQKTLELEDANNKLKDLDRLKSMFIASMSHELRTPLNSIIGFSSILHDEWTGAVNAEQKENLAIILRSGKHLLNLINDVIDISKIEAGKIECRFEDFDLNEVISEAANLLTGEIKEKGLSLTVAADSFQMHTDRRRLLQCVINLLSNAVKFTKKGFVRISTRKGVRDPGLGDFVELSVEDTGIGIQEEDLPKLFGSFVRLEPPLRTAIKGTGLGLYLTKKLVTEVLKGDIICTSSYGAGSVFTMRIPMVLE